MALGKRKREQQSARFAATELPKSPGHPFLQEAKRAVGGSRLDGMAESGSALRITPPRWDAIRSRPAFTFAWF